MWFSLLLTLLKPNSWTYSFAEISGHNLEISQTWGFRIQRLHYKTVTNHFCSNKSVSRGDCEQQGGKLWRILSHLHPRMRPLVERSRFYAKFLEMRLKISLLFCLKRYSACAALYFMFCTSCIAICICSVSVIYKKNTVISIKNDGRSFLLSSLLRRFLRILFLFYFRYRCSACAGSISACPF